MNRTTVKNFKRYFNSRSRTGSDAFSVNLNLAGKYFNSRSRTGSDRRAAGRRRDYGISIHAPAQGATAAARSINQHIDISIHAPAQGATPNYIRSMTEIIFQFTLPHRERQDTKTGRFDAFYFNSRSRTGSDRCSSSFSRLPHNFNSRSRTGSDRSATCTGQEQAISIHAPAQGATDLFPLVRPCPSISIHAPAQGATDIELII